MMVDGRLKVECSKSGRATCTICGSTIAMGVLRIGRESTLFGRTNVRWHHSKCFGEHYPEVDFVSMAGFALLGPKDQESMRSIGSNTEKKVESNVTSASMSVGLISSGSTTSSFELSQLSKTYKDVPLPNGWKGFSTLILYEADNVKPSEKIAAFDFDGTLANTSLSRPGADAWSLLYPSITAKLGSYYQQGYKLVIFTNESNIDRWTKQRAKAIASKIGRLKSFMETVKVPMQVFIACGKSSSDDSFRKPATGMWELLENHLNGGMSIDRDRSFYVGDAAGRKTDHSDADIQFAKRLGLKFLLPEDMFLSETLECAGQSHHNSDIEQKNTSHALQSESLRSTSPETP